MLDHVADGRVRNGIICPVVVCMNTYILSLNSHTQKRRNEERQILEESIVIFSRPLRDDFCSSLSKHPKHSVLGEAKQDILGMTSKMT